MKLTVKTHHEASAIQNRMIAEYIDRDNRHQINEYEEAHVFYRLTDAGYALVKQDHSRRLPQLNSGRAAKCGAA